MGSIKCFGDLKAGDVIYKVDINNGTIIPYYIITEIVTIKHSSGRVAFECDYYDSKHVSYTRDILFLKYSPYCIFRQDIYLSDPNLEELCRNLVILKVQSMAENFNDLFGGLFKVEL